MLAARNIIDSETYIAREVTKGEQLLSLYISNVQKVCLALKDNPIHEFPANKGLGKVIYTQPDPCKQ